MEFVVISVHNLMLKTVESTSTNQQLILMRVHKMTTYQCHVYLLCGKEVIFSSDKNGCYFENDIRIKSITWRKYSVSEKDWRCSNLLTLGRETFKYFWCLKRGAKAKLTLFGMLYFIKYFCIYLTQYVFYFILFLDSV